MTELFLVDGFIQNGTQMNRREFFHGCRTTIVGGIALVLGLPAAPKAKQTVLIGLHHGFAEGDLIIFHLKRKIDQEITEIFRVANVRG